MDDTAHMLSSSLMVSCTAFEFGDPLLTPVPLWPGQHDGAAGEVLSLHPTRRRAASPAHQTSLVTATIYPLHPSSGPHPSSRYAYGAPFPGATVRCTRQGVTVYRTSDRAFLVDVRWIDVKELKRHVPPEDPSLTEIALVFSRGILVMDVASSYIARGFWAALEHCRVLTDARVTEALRSSAWSDALGGDGLGQQTTFGSPAHNNTAVPLQKATAPTPAIDEREEHLVRRAQEVLERFLGPNHNLTITSPGRRGQQEQQDAPSLSLQRAASTSTARTPPPQAALRTDVTSPKDSPDGAMAAAPSVSEEDAASWRLRSVSQVSARDRADHIRREQDEQLQRLRRREEEMRRDIHHTSHSRSHSTRSLSHATSASIDAAGHARVGMRTASPDVAAQDRRRRAAAAARSESLPLRASPSVPRAVSSRAPLPLPKTTEISRTVPEHRTVSVPASHTSGMSHERDASFVVSQGRYDSTHASIARTHQREQLTSDIGALMDSLHESERTSTAGATAQAKRVTESLRISLHSDEPKTTEMARHDLRSNNVDAATTTAQHRTAAAHVVEPRRREEEGTGAAVANAAIHAPTAPADAAAVQRPAVAAAPVAASPAVPYAGDWSSRTTADGRTYYVNSKTRVTSWKREDTDLPEQGDTDSSSPAGRAGGIPPKEHASPTRVQPHEPGPGWRAVVSDKGKTYYVHAASKNTTWNVEDTLPKKGGDGTREASASEATRPSTTASTQPVENASTGGSTSKAKQSTGSTDPASAAAIAAADPPSTTAAGASATSAITASAHVAASTAAEKASDAPAAAAVQIEASADTSQHASVIQDPEDVRRENEARKKAAHDKVEEDKKNIRIGGMTMMEALMQEQQAMLRASGGAPTSPSKERSAPSTASTQDDAVCKDPVRVVAGPSSTGSEQPATAAVTPASTAAADTAAGPKPQSSAPVVAPGGNLFGNWKELYHKESKRTYYRNVSTNASTWHMPEEVRAMKDAIASREAASQSQHSATPRNDEGVAQRATSVASESSPSNARSAPLRVKGAWSEKVDPKSGRHYYVNSETKQRTWKVEETPFSSSSHE